VISGLKAGARYEFFIVSTNVDGQTTLANKDMRFTTTSHNDRKAPSFIVAPQVYDVLDNSALLTWQTDDFASAIIDYGITKQNLSTRHKVIDFEQRHSWLMSGLDVGTRYYYRVTSIDYAGNTKRSELLRLRTRGTALDTDGDGISDALDTDDDNDGIPDIVELDYGLDSKNSRDGTLDLDADGMSNIEEFIAKTNLFKDSVAPVLTIPANISVIAMGPNTIIDIGVATAMDYHDGVLRVENDAPTSFSAGEYSVNWRVSDKQGNQSIATQLISVIPSVHIATAKSVREGEQLKITFYFHGTAIDYPVIIPYRISGTATAGTDHDLHDGKIVISTGNKASIVLNAIEDYAYDMPEYIDISLGNIENAAASESSSVRIAITE
ncbi:MAG: fibronectin type III domain-containing protein, partial [Thiohalomonadales bacterium]